MTSKLETSLFARYKGHVLAGRMTARQSFWLLLLMDELSVNPDGTFGDEVEILIHHEGIGRQCLQDMTVREAAKRLDMPMSTFYIQTHAVQNLPTLNSEGCVIDSENETALFITPAPAPLEVCKIEIPLFINDPNSV